MEELLEMVELALLQTSVLVECTLPYSAGDFLAKIHKVSPNPITSEPSPQLPREDTQGEP